jgi:hypothetical protein
MFASGRILRADAGASGIFGVLPAAVRSALSASVVAQVDELGAGPRGTKSSLDTLGVANRPFDCSLRENQNVPYSDYERC